ncbi:response regulator transcription factor [Devriesea agamarum]|uniref:response regulator transcription factor n=1 Tax=Devriesea agamarum TaxID=472569 RepID=UPI00071D6DC8|nr:response regulator transcription factor [Devriesea agamarum]
MSNTTRVMIVDDHEVVRRGIADVIDSAEDLSVVAEASTVAEALRRLPAVRPDLLLVDLQLPDGTGVDVMTQARQLNPEQLMLVLTSFDDQAAVKASQELGARGFLLKTVRSTEMLAAIRSVVAGTDDWKGVVVEEEDDFSSFDLTDVEVRIVELIGEGRSNREIAAAMGIAEKTVKNRLTQILSKMGLTRRTQIAAWVAGRHAAGWQQH